MTDDGMAASPSTTGEEMTLSRMLAVVDALGESGIRYWVTGGWGVDVLVGAPTRPHRDLDIDIDAAHEERTLDLLAHLGSVIETDELPTRAEVDGAAGRIDVHPLLLDAAGDARQAAPDRSFWHWPRRFFTTTRFEGREIPCYTVEAQRFFHRGYEPRNVDLVDLGTLDRLDGGDGE